jgi:hypothetical protein
VKSRVLFLAAATLPVGFLVAEITGVRAVGGVVLALLAATTLFVARAPVSRTAAWLGVVAVAFALSHVIADVVSTVGAIGIAAAVVTAAASSLLVEPGATGRAR